MPAGSATSRSTARSLTTPPGRLAKMNLAIRGIDAQVAHGDTFHNDRHPDLKADYRVFYRHDGPRLFEPATPELSLARSATVPFAPPTAARTPTAPDSKRASGYPPPANCRRADGRLCGPR